jgi:ribonucleoside-triphosphate reductase
MMQEEAVLVPGMDGVWGDYEVEARMVLRAFNEVYSEGDAMGRPFTFPIATINLLPTTPFDDPLWIDLVKTTLKFGTYSFFNYIGSGIDPNSILSMCCRLAIDLNEIANAGGRWAYAGETGSIGVVTLNMSKIGYLSANKDEFYKLLNEVLTLAKNSLISKGIFIEQHKDRFMPFDVMYGTDFTRFFRTIGIVGLNEMCENFLGKPLSQCPEFVKEVLHYMREWTRTTQKETGVLWNLEMTPAEGCATRLAMKDKKLYGDDIYTKGVEGAYYYTSMITPPDEDLEFLDRLKIEENLLTEFSGGTVNRQYFGEGYFDPVVVAKLIEKIAKNTKIPYFDISPTYSICNVCGGYQRGVHDKCADPKCEGTTTTFDRIVGYYRPRNNCDSGKLEEIKSRRLVQQI